MNSKTDLVRASRDWVRTASTKEAFAELESQVALLTGHDKPVVTLFGAYDTGKSALLRRLLVDSGAAVPDWLTISGRHETFQTNAVDALGCVIRDTPGLVLEDESNRAKIHDAASTSAVEFTDALLLVLPPQLATAERDVLVELLSQDWPPGSLACVVNRFDEAGVSPDDDPEGYAELAQRKVAELRESLPLPAGAPVFVVASDPYGLNGAEQQPEGSVWDEFRAWDGMGALAGWIQALPENLPTMRAAAAGRVWRRSLATSLISLEGALGDMSELHREAEAAGERIRLDAKSLGVIDRAARARLDAAIEEVLLDADRRSSVDESWLETNLQSALDNWFDQSVRELARLEDELINDYERQVKRPIMARLGLSAPAADGPTRTISPKRDSLKRYGDIGLRAWDAVRTATNPGAVQLKKPTRLRASVRDRSATELAKRPTGSPTVTKSDKAYLATAAALPLVYELADLLNSKEADFRQAQAAQKRRQELRTQIQLEARKAANLYRLGWDEQVEAHRQQTRSAWAGLAGQAPQLKAQLAEQSALLADGRELQRQWLIAPTGL